MPPTKNSRHESQLVRFMVTEWQLLRKIKKPFTNNILTQTIQFNYQTVFLVLVPYGYAFKFVNKSHHQISHQKSALC